MEFVRFENLTKAYRGHLAVHEASGGIAKGEMVSIVGPSGSGKSTLLRILAGLLEPEQGRLWLEGTDITGLPANRRNFGVVFQSYALFPHLTVEGNVMFPLRIAKWPRAKARARVEELLERVGLRHHHRKYPRQLSGGEQQRVALARALAPVPSVLLLDEPLSALDAQVRVAMREEIRRLQKDLGVTTIHITHDQEEALSLSDRILVMNRGRIVQTGTPAEIYWQPTDGFVASFVGKSNRLSVQVLDRRQGVGMWKGMPLRVVGLEALGDGDRAQVIVRPEQVAVRETGSSGGWTAQVTGKTLLGPILRLQLTVDGTPLLADLLSSQEPSVRVGQTVSVQLLGARLLAEEPEVPADREGRLDA